MCHFPPGTSKWNKVVPRLFSAITSNWRGRPLESHEVVINLIAGTTTRTGLAVHAERDTSYYPTGVKVTNAELAAVPLTGHPFHPEWNYTIGPGPKNPTVVATRKYFPRGSLGDGLLGRQILRQS